MSPNPTHCLPDGVLDANAIGVPGTPGQSSIYIPSGGFDAVQGVCIMYKGLSIGPSAGKPVAEDPDGPTFFPLYFATMVSDLTADGWAVLLPAAPEDVASVGSATAAILNDVSNDTGYGVRYLNTCLHLFDHQKDWANRNWPGKGVMVMGVSRGGWIVLKILNARSSELVGGIARCPATLWENASPTFTSPYDFYNYNFSGMDVGPDELNNVGDVPTLVSYGTIDFAAGWGGNTTVAASEAGTNVTSFTGTQSLALNSATEVAKMIPGMTLRVTGLTGGVGQAFFSFGGLSGASLTDVTLLAGSGTLESGCPAVNSLTDTVINNAQAAGANVSRHIGTGEDHSLTLADDAAFLTFIQDNIDPLR